jgi:hypothetical protein
VLHTSLDGATISGLRSLAGQRKIANP